MSKMIDITGQVFGELTAISYEGNREWLCRCSCGETCLVNSYRLRKGYIKTCGHDNANTFKDLTGQQFGEWTVLSYVGNSIWRCRCSCNEIKEVHSYSLRTGGSKSCGHTTSKFKDLTGQQFGDYTVIEYKGDRKWLCKCSCGESRLVHGYDLVSGHSKSCGHNTNRFKDLTNQKFTFLTPIKYIGNGYWTCKCDCGNSINVKGEHLRNGLIRSCGCKKTELQKETLLSKYGELKPNKEIKRTQEQIEILHSKEKLVAKCVELINILNRKPFVIDLVNELNVTSSTVLKKLHLFGLENLVCIDNHTSNAEIEISKLFENKILRDTSVLSKYKSEIDVYVPEHKLGIEFNGSYWHSTLYKDMFYHQKKTLAAIKEKIHLIHIFEYEWLKDKEKILNHLRGFNERLESDGLYIKYINNEIAEHFITKYTIYNYKKSNIEIGVFKDNKLYGVCGFDKVNNQGYINNLYWFNNIQVENGDKIIIDFILNNFDIKSIHISLDLSKQNPLTYARLGFKVAETSEMIAHPEYVWVDTKDNDVLTHSQIMNIDTFSKYIRNSEKEDEVMEDFGYIKIYNSGKMKMTLKVE